MQVTAKALKPVSEIQLSADETKILKWLKTADWQAQEAKVPTMRARVPEFFSGVRMYKLQGGPPSAGGAHGALDLFLKKLEFSGVISKQDMYPVAVQGQVRYLSLRKSDLDGLGAGKNDYDEDEDYED